MLLCPIKQGIKVKKWYAKNADLKSLAEFFLCQSQGFGENPDYYSFLNIKGHNGLDIVYEDGTEVFSSHDGKAMFSEDSMKGLGVAITNTQLGIKTIYWHLKSSPLLKDNLIDVKRGQWIGNGDSTGFSTAPHLHYGLKLLDNTGNVINRDNGYDGCVDPTPYIIWQDPMTEQEVRQLQSLEGYKDEAGVAYWTGKSLGEYLKARLPDKIKTLQESI